MRGALLIVADGLGGRCSPSREIDIEQAGLDDAAVAHDGDAGGETAMVNRDREGRLDPRGRLHP